MSKISKTNSKLSKSSKVFAVFTKFEPIRKSLTDRGWTENGDKYYVNLSENSQGFIWNPRSYKISEGAGTKVIVNRIKRTQHLDFTSKVGLKYCAENYQWNCLGQGTNLFIPRSHFITDHDSLLNFLEDIKLTKSISFLKFLHTNRDFQSLFSDFGAISFLECVNFAIKVIKFHKKVKQNNVIDHKIPHPKSEKHFSTFDTIMIHNGKFKTINDIELFAEIKASIEDALVKVVKIWPERKYDGMKNLWIIKPIGGSCGQGISLMNKEEDILKVTKKRFSQNYIIQKYMGKLVLLRVFLTFFHY